MITNYHHSANLVMQIGDPRGRFFYPTLILMMDSYNVLHSFFQFITLYLFSCIPFFLLECLSDSDCGDGGQCVSGFCDCLTSSCSQLAYIALPGCGRYCQCDIASGEWKQQTCNPLSNELFDETINTCNRMESVEPYICASGETSILILVLLNIYIYIGSKIKKSLSLTTYSAFFFIPYPNYIGLE